VKHQRHIDASAVTLREARQTRRLIADIDRIVQILDSDIAAEEEQARIFDRCQVEYPMLARTLAVRRDNLRHTTAALEQRLLNLPTELEPA
jgi:septation ring formation regulator EzrA